MIQMIPLAHLHAHPGNPRLRQRDDVVEQIAATLNGHMEERYALTVRANGEGYQILAGHHRHAAASKAGLQEVPCWIVEMDDSEAFLELVRSNAQSELTALERGMHALLVVKPGKHGQSAEAYAKAIGRAHQIRDVRREVAAAAVANEIGNIADLVGYVIHLAEVHAAPFWLWPALVEALVAKSWTVEKVREQVARVKAAPEPAAWMDAGAIANAIVTGVMKLADVGRMAKVVEDAAITTRRLRSAFMAALATANPASLSAVQAIVHRFVETQEDRARKARAHRQRRQSKSEDAAKSRAQRRDRLLDAVSLEQDWLSLDAAEKTMVLTGDNVSKRSFNKQDNEAIEWAQWSWNPVTGCLHDCPYCYARDIALQKRMAKVYPNGFAPTLKPRLLLAPRNMAVPGEAHSDERYRNVFTCSMADLFGRWVPEDWIEAVLREMRSAPDWNFLCLTKFPKRMAEFDLPANAWMGTTVDLQARVAAAEAGFAKVKAGVRWLSIEPMLEPLRFKRLDLFQWLVIGGSSASSKTPEWVPPFEWVADLVRQGREAGCSIYFKTNLGIKNRILELPFKAPIKRDPIEAPAIFHYLGKS